MNTTTAWRACHARHLGEAAQWRGLAKPLGPTPGLITMSPGPAATAHAIAVAKTALATARISRLSQAPCRRCASRAEDRETERDLRTRFAWRGSIRAVHAHWACGSSTTCYYGPVHTLPHGVAAAVFAVTGGEEISCGGLRWPSSAPAWTS